MDAWAELAVLEAADGFVNRHIGPSESDIAAMLHTVGAATLDDLAAKTVPPAIRTNHALELPEIGRDVAADEACAVVESVKAASDLYAPLTGKVVETNQTIIDDPSIVNSDAEGEGWFFRLE